VSKVNGLAPEGGDQSWLVRFDRSAATVAAAQPVGLGDIVSLWRGMAPPTSKPGSATAGVAGAAGPVGETGKWGERGRRRKPGRNAKSACKVRHRRSGKRQVRCAVKHRESVKAKRRKVSKKGMEG
jgi:hypothetical protein